SAATSSIPGVSTTGSSSLGTVLVAGRKRVPRPAAGTMAVRGTAALEGVIFGHPFRRSGILVAQCHPPVLGGAASGSATGGERVDPAAEAICGIVGKGRWPGRSLTGTLGVPSWPASQG